MAELEQVRLMICQDCKSIEEIPDYDGPVEYDYLLEAASSRHTTASGLRHIGIMCKVPADAWNTPQMRMEIIQQLKERTGKGLGDEFYAVKETFKEDAMRCWKQHNRTRNCDDFKSDAKRIVPDTKADRKDLGLAPMKSNRFVCEFCPVHAVMMQRMRADRGDYDYSL
jgi:hypothetical protein